MDALETLPTPLADLLAFVDTVETPTAGMRLPVRPSDHDLAIMSRMREISRAQRRDLVRGIEPKDFQKNSLGFLDLSSLGGALSSITSKITEIVQRPGFVTSLASAASFIPKIGPTVSGLLASIAPKQPSVVTNAAGTSVAASQAFGLPGNLLSSLPEPLKSAAAGLAAKLAPQTAAGGQDMLSALLKSVGQFAATQQIAGASGLGAFGIPGADLAGLAAMISGMGGSDIQGAIKAGQNDYLNAASLTNSTAALQKAFAEASAFPWIPVAAIGGGTIFLLGMMMVLSRRSR